MKDVEHDCKRGPDDACAVCDVEAPTEEADLQAEKDEASFNLYRALRDAIEAGIGTEEVAGIIKSAYAKEGNSLHLKTYILAMDLTK